VPAFEPGLNGVTDTEQALDPGERSNSLPVPGDSPHRAQPQTRPSHFFSTNHRDPDNHRYIPLKSLDL